MIKDLSAEQTMFSIANRLFRERRYEDAIGIYEYLADLHPEFNQYHSNELTARKLLINSGEGKIKKSRKYHLASADDRQKRLRIAHMLSFDSDKKVIDFIFHPEEIIDYPQVLLSHANAAIASGYDVWLQDVNAFLVARGMARIGLKITPDGLGEGVFLNITGASLETVSGPLVTICMSCFNAERYVEHAVRSILNQSHRNFELLLFNDRSEDGTLAILERLAKEDTRIILTNNQKNQGTYVSRNQALQRAQGKYFAIMDADDFSLPDRIAKQVGHLESEPNQVGMLTTWVRMKEDGYFHFKNGWGGGYEHEAVATLMFRTKKIRETIGYWDSVRFAADTEFMFRMRKCFGTDSVPLLSFPTEISLFHEDSLTNNPITGIDISSIRGLSPVRKAYRDSWNAWHQDRHQDKYIPYPLIHRLFDAPAEMVAE
jgi:glycosyltransferase involved in cell wall biosynthesis